MASLGKPALVYKREITGNVTAAFFPELYYGVHNKADPAVIAEIELSEEEAKLPLDMLRRLYPVPQQAEA